MGVCSHRARNLTGGDFITRRHQAFFGAFKFSIKPRQFQPECHGFSVDTVASANGGSVFMFFGSGAERVQQFIKVCQHQISGAG